MKPRVEATLVIARIQDEKEAPKRINRHRAALKLGGRNSSGQGRKSTRGGILGEDCNFRRGACGWDACINVLLNWSLCVDGETRSEREAYKYGKKFTKNASTGTLPRLRGTDASARRTSYFTSRRRK